MFDMPEWLDTQITGARHGSRFAGVRFQRVGKIYHYITNGFNLKVGDWVVVDTARGRQMGQVASIKPPRDVSDMGAFKRIERLATGRDMAMRHFYESKELEAMIACRAESNALGLPIKIVKAEYSFDGQTLTFLFSSDQEERVETNDLRQVMSRLYRARIETRQVSPREVAKIIGGMGACGIEQRCCSRFLTEFSPISIKHAKEQGLSLNPHDITGMCGRLRCCLIYEYEQYVEARRHLPKKNAMVGTPSGPGKVIDLLPMRDSVLVLVGEGEGAKAVVVHRELIVPLEEYKRLQDKAASGTCDKHEGGNCDCGKDKPSDAKTAEQPAAEQAVALSADQVTQGAVAPAKAEGPQVDSRPKKHKKNNRNPGARAQESAEPAGAGQAPAQPRPARPDRQPFRPVRQPRRGERLGRPGEQTPRSAEIQDNPPILADTPQPLDGPEMPAASRPQRRPLRRPLPRKPEQGGENPPQENTNP
jgi:cell fate regulator YaaT (PSP1 superfamily)